MALIRKKNRFSLYFSKINQFFILFYLILFYSVFTLLQYITLLVKMRSVKRPKIKCINLHVQLVGMSQVINQKEFSS